MKWETKESEELFEAILGLETKEEAKAFFRDLLTSQEIVEFSRRWKAAQMLSKKVPYTQIQKETGLSSTTVARISKWLNSGMNGYKLAIKRTTHHDISPEMS